MLSTRVPRWTALGAVASVAAGLAMLVFGGGCATRALIRNTGVRVEVPVRFTRILATETQMIVEFDAYTNLSPWEAEYAEEGPIAPRWATRPIDEIFARRGPTIRSGQLPFPPDLAAAAVVARREGNVFVSEEKPPRFAVALNAAPTHDITLTFVRLADAKQGGGFNRDMLIRRPRDAWAYPVIAVTMPFALLWDGVTLPFWGTYLLLLLVFGT